MIEYRSSSPFKEMTAHLLVPSVCCKEIHMWIDGILPASFEYTSFRTCSLRTAALESGKNQCVSGHTGARNCVKLHPMRAFHSNAVIIIGKNE